MPHDIDRKPETPFAFSGYGLSLHANCPIPGLSLAAEHREADVRIWFGELPPGHEHLLDAGELWFSSSNIGERGQPGLVICKSSDGSYFHWKYLDGNEFFISQDGAEVWANWPQNRRLSDAAAYLLGPVLGVILRRRGVTCLHASAVSFEDRVIAFVGPKGAGKSTTAAAFAGRGYPVVADDIVALVSAGGSFLAQPGYPRLRLWPPSLNALARTGSPASRSLPGDWGDKRYHLDLTVNGCEFEQRALPLAAMYFLADREKDSFAPRFEGMSGGEGLMTLVANTYGSKLLDNAGRAAEFKVLDRLAGRLLLRKFYSHNALENLTALCDVILRDFLEARTTDAALALS